MTVSDRADAAPSRVVTMELSELKAGLRLGGFVAAGEVTVVAVEPHGDGIVNVVYRADDGQISDKLVTAARRSRPWA